MEKQPFGERLREIRENHGISMRSLASSADMDPAYLSRIENGKTGAPKQETVERLAQALCEESQLEVSECERLKRRLLVAAGHLQHREDLIDDLAERFAAKLRDEGFPEPKIDEALARVSLPTMRAVLLGEEKLDMDYVASVTPPAMEWASDAGDDLLMADMLAPTISDEAAQPPTVDAGDSATGYLDRHAEDFATHRRQKRALSSGGPRRVFRAGRDAEIRVQRRMTKEQEQQLRLLAKLIDKVLEEK